MPPSKRTRKQQTRLVFTPIPSSSPATKGYHSQIQARAAAVDYDASPRPSKRQRLRAIDGHDNDSDLAATQLDAVGVELPTPAKSSIPSQRGLRLNGHHDESSELVRSEGTHSSSCKHTRRAKQRQLDFSTSRDPESFSSPITLQSSSAVLPQSSAGAGIFSSRTRRTRKQRPVIDFSSDESDVSDLLSESKASMDIGRVMSDTTEMGGQTSRVTRNSSKVNALTDSDEDDTIVVRHGKNSTAEAAATEESEEDMPTTLGKQPRKRTRRTSMNSFISSSPPPVIESDDDDLEIIENPSPRASNNGEDDEEEEEEDDDVPVTPGRRTLRRPRQVSRQEQEDLDEDLDFLGPSSDVEDGARAPRNTQSEAKNKRQQALELLKRKRSGQRQSAPEDRDDTIAGGDGSYEESDEEQPLITSSRQMFRADDEDEEFIDEEEADDSTLGVPDGVPIQFTRYASMKSKELFKFAVEWMVQKKINPAFRMDDEIYDLAFKKLNDEVSGLAASKFVSSAWKPDFVIALNARPEIAFFELDSYAKDFTRDKCEACNRTNHTPSFEVQFMGKPYDPETLEEVGGGDDEDDAGSSDTSDDGSESNAKTDDYDYQGRKVPPESRTYYLGRFCKTNAETAHDLSHWRHHLYDWVVTWLIKEGYNSSDKIVKRDRWSTKKRRKYANKIVDRMEREGQVKELWHAFRKNLDDARSSKQGRYKGDSP